MLTRKTVIQAIRETTYGTDPVMTPSNSLYAYDVDLDIKGETLTRDILRDTLTPMPHVIGLKECSLTFKVELKGVASPTFTEPQLGMLLSGCGFNTGSISGTARVYALTSDEALMSSIAFKANKDGNTHKILGGRGNAKVNLEAGKYGYVEFAYQGLYDPVAAATVPDHTGSQTGVPPIVYNSSFQIAGFSPVCSKAEIDIANEIVRRDSLNATNGVQSFRITGRKPTMSFDADAVVESSHAFWGKWVAATVGTWGCNVGSNAGNTIRLAGYYVPETTKYGDQDGVSKYDVKAALCSSDVTTSNDEMTIAFS